MFFRRFHAHLDRHYHARIKSLKVGSFTVIHAEQGWEALRKALLGLQLAILVVAAYIYLEYVFHLYPWTRPAARDLLSYVFEPVRSIAFALLAYLPKLAFLVILTILTRYLLKLTRLFFASLEAGTLALGTFDPDWATPTYKLVRMAVIAFAVVVAYPYLPGSESAAFKGVSLFLGVMLSLGSSSAISNVVAGYSMTYRKAFKLGDRVKIGDQIGEVLETRLLVTRLRTPKNEEVIIPNSEILNQHVVNFSSLARTEGLILHTRVGIGYETPWRQVEAMLLAAAERTPGLKTEPRPFVLQRELGDFAVTYELNVYTDRPGAMLRTYTELHRNILDLFNEYGVQIMTPAYEGDPSSRRSSRRSSGTPRRRRRRRGRGRPDPDPSAEAGTSPKQSFRAREDRWRRIRRTGALLRHGGAKSDGRAGRCGRTASQAELDSPAAVPGCARWASSALRGAPQLRGEAPGAVHLLERFEDRGARQRDRPVHFLVEPVVARQRVDVAVEDQPDQPRAAVQDGRTGVAADDVVVGREIQEPSRDRSWSGRSSMIEAARTARVPSPVRTSLRSS